ncbi:hypothetical protein LOAG_11400 [Loa loa]|uniref:Uncharacterized protein n=1 Tax=Loa loa TaxID=7209 RepID=A0A1S0TNL6_LOALO|nr:hypothetical protein LOAG_11400 [Loa loa]EFO17102.1 hypothetical protein LOAG_11400 [Loa loa]
MCTSLYRITYCSIGIGIQNVLFSRNYYWTIRQLEQIRSSQELMAGGTVKRLQDSEIAYCGHEWRTANAPLFTSFCTFFGFVPSILSKKEQVLYQLIFTGNLEERTDSLMRTLQQTYSSANNFNMNVE